MHRVLMPKPRPAQECQLLDVLFPRSLIREPFGPRGLSIVPGRSHRVLSTDVPPSPAHSAEVLWAFVESHYRRRNRPRATSEPTGRAASRRARSGQRIDVSESLYPGLRATNVRPSERVASHCRAVRTESSRHGARSPQPAGHRPIRSRYRRRRLRASPSDPG